MPSEGPGLESKPFRCSYCPKEFGHLSSLESHVERLHTNEAKHNCDVCGKAYSSKSNLTAHRKIHSGEKRETKKKQINVALSKIFSTQKGPAYWSEKLPKVSLKFNILVEKNIPFVR